MFLISKARSSQDRAVGIALKASSPSRNTTSLIAPAFVQRKTPQNHPLSTTPAQSNGIAKSHPPVPDSSPSPATVANTSTAPHSPKSDSSAKLTAFYSQYCCSAIAQSPAADTTSGEKYDDFQSPPESSAPR